MYYLKHNAGGKMPIYKPRPELTEGKSAEGGHKKEPTKTPFFFSVSYF